MKRSLLVVAGALAAATSYGQVTSDLVGYYPFKGDATDASGRGNDGTIFGATPTTDRFGVLDAALYFDGSDWVDLGDKADFQFEDDFSISLWVEFPGNDQHGNIIYKRRATTPYPQYGFGVFDLECCWSSSPGNTLGALVRNDQSNSLNPGDRALEATDDPLAAGWHHIVMINEADGRSLLYLDNVLIDSTTATAGTHIIAGAPLTIGGFDANDANKYTGKIDDVHIYSRSLDAAAIDSLFNAPAPVSLDEGLVGHYPFEGDATDASGRGNDGTIFGATPTTDRFGVPDAALSFDGSDWVDLGDSTDFRFQEDFSISLWIEFSGGPQHGNIIYKRNPSPPYPQYGFGMFDLECCWSSSPSNTLGAFVRKDQSNSLNPSDRVLEATDAPLAAGWHHIVMVNEADGRSSLYLNNVLVDSMTTESAGTHAITGAPLTVGGFDAADANKYTGKIDDVRLYNRVLNTVEIDSLFNVTSTVTSLAGETATRLAVYPNPVTDYLTVSGADADATAELVDLQGRTVLRERLSQGRIGTASLAEGFYFLLVKDRRGAIVGRQKVVKR